MDARTPSSWGSLGFSVATCKWSSMSTADWPTPARACRHWFLCPERRTWWKSDTDRSLTPDSRLERRTESLIKTICLTKLFELNKTFEEVSFLLWKVQKWFILKLRTGFKIRWGAASVMKTGGNFSPSGKFVQNDFHKLEWIKVSEQCRWY